MAGLSSQTVHASVYQAGAESVAPQWINAASRPAAVIGINLSQNSGERLLGVGVNFTDVGGDGGFGASDLAPLAMDSWSGVALYIDNKTGGTYGVFDGADAAAALSSLPQWTATAGGLSTTLSTGGVPIPANDLGNNTGPDFFVVVRTSATASRGDDFTVSLGPGDIRTDNGPPDFPAVETPAIVFDTVPPVADAGPDVAVDEGAEMGFSAARSSDDIGIANYTWTFGDFSPDNLRYGVYVTYTFASPGRYFVLLNVSDYAGNSDQDVLLVTVRNLNQPPVINSAPPITARQGVPYVYLMQAQDPDGDLLRFSRAEGPANLTVNSTNGLVLWVPGPDDPGSVPVTLAVTDGRSPPVAQAFRIDVQNVNNPPYFQSLPVVIALQGQQYIYKAAARDRDNDQLAYSLVAGPRGMTVGTYTGEVRWTPAWDQVGLSRVVIAASDREFTAYQDFYINVTNANDDPVIRSSPQTTALQGVPYTYLVLADDPDNDTLRYSFNASPAGMRIGAANGLVTWTPASEQVGQNFVMIEASDGHGGRDVQSFIITVVNVNDPPRIESAPPPTARQGANFTYRVQAFDPDGDAVRFELLSWPPGMSLNSSSGLIEWTPGQSSVGRVSVTVLASDGLGGIDVQAFNLTVQDVNDPPVVAGDIPPVAHRDRPYIAQVRAFDPDGDALTYTLVNELEDISLDRNTGTLVWYPRVVQNQTIAVRVTDVNGSSTDAYFNVTVLPTPEPPSVAPVGLLRARAGQRFSFRVAASDRSGGPLSFSTSSKLFVINSTTGVVSFSPGDGDVGAHEFSVDVRNAAGLNTTVAGVLVVEGAPGGLSLSRIAGFGLAGLGGADPRILLAVTLLIGAALFYQFARLRRREARERPEEETLAAEEARRSAPGGVTEEERAALLARQKQEREAAAPGVKEASARSRAGAGPADRETLERKAREWDEALREQRAARERREREEAANRARDEAERQEKERGLAEEMERKARELREREEAERREVLQKIEKERQVLSREEQERLEREVEKELAEAGLGGLEEKKPAAPRKKVAPKRVKRRS
jgi:hypothetical protein